MSRDLSLLSNRLAIAALVVGACALTAVPAAPKTTLLGTPPVAIEIRAEPLTGNSSARA
jgi:hypothetical protein